MLKNQMKNVPMQPIFVLNFISLHSSWDAPSEWKWEAEAEAEAEEKAIVAHQQNVMEPIFISCSLHGFN